MKSILRFFALLAVAGLVLPAWGMGSKPPGGSGEIRVGGLEAEEPAHADLPSRPKKAAHPQARLKPERVAKVNRKAKAAAAVRGRSVLAKSVKPAAVKRAAIRKSAVPISLAKLEPRLRPHVDAPRPAAKPAPAASALMPAEKTVAPDDHPVAVSEAVVEVTPAPVTPHRAALVFAPPVIPVLMAAVTWNRYVATARASDPFRVR